MWHLSRVDRADERFRLLIRQYCEDHEIDIEAHGAQSKVARAFGNLSPSTINKILSGERGAGEDARDKAAKALRLDPAFFKVASLGDRARYTEWQGKTRTVRDVHEMPGVTAFFEDKRNAALARFRATVNVEMHSQTGDVPPSRVRKYVDILRDEEDRGERQFPEPDAS
jgi:transcriptional regulator with XRE-family HTH domain